MLMLPLLTLRSAACQICARATTFTACFGARENIIQKEIILKNFPPQELRVMEATEKLLFVVTSSKLPLNKSPWQP